MKIFNINAYKNIINFKNNNTPKLPNLDMFGANFSNPFSVVERDIFIKKPTQDDDDDILKNVDDKAFKLAFSEVDEEIGPEAEALWKLNFAIPFYIEVFGREHERGLFAKSPLS